MSKLTCKNVCKSFYIENEEETVRLVDLAKKHNVCLIPYGGGTNVTNALRPPKKEKRIT